MHLFRSSPVLVSLVAILLSLYSYIQPSIGVLAQSGTCSDAASCLIGCCNKNNACGFGDDYCLSDAGCKSG